MIAALAMIAAFAMIAAPAALAAEPDSTTDQWLPLPPAETGKPAIAMPPPAAAPLPERPSCPPALPCGTRLYGAIGKNGAVELKVPALSW
jgi:hypothetical protein